MKRSPLPYFVFAILCTSIATVARGDPASAATSNASYLGTDVDRFEMASQPLALFPMSQAGDTAEPQFPNDALGVDFTQGGAAGGATASAPTTSPTTTPVSNNTTPPSGTSNITASFTSGVIVSVTVGTERVSSVKFIQQTGGGVYAQIAGNQNVNAGLVLTLGFPSPDFDLAVTPSKSIGTTALDLLMCGPFTFLKSGTKGCGPIVLGAATSGSSNVIGQAGAGWSIDTGISPNKTNNIAFSIGILVDPSDTVLDTKVVNPRTDMVYPAFQAAAVAGTVSATVSDPTVGIFAMLSFEF